MAFTDELPPAVVDLMASGAVAEYATVSAAGVPIDTACLYFPSADLATFDIATGLAYPAKAERARNNPRVGLLIEGLRDEPVVSIAGMAAVRDADPQANALRYIAETGHAAPGNPEWELARHAVHYWTRIIVEITPARIMWWDKRSAMDVPPHVWAAPPETVFPQSDPRPAGPPSKPAAWPVRPWADLARHALVRKVPAHLTMTDPEGFPLPIRALAVEQAEGGFDLVMPPGATWLGDGKASLSFEGLETFIGEARGEGGHIHLAVERALPLNPLMYDNRELWSPSSDTRTRLMERLEQECARRGVPVPVLPATKPQSTAGALRRQARLAALPRKRDLGRKPDVPLD